MPVPKKNNVGGRRLMVMSILTKKWQTTIPKKVRDHLRLNSGDKVVYVREGQMVYIQTIRDNIANVERRPSTEILE